MGTRACQICKGQQTTGLSVSLPFCVDCLRAGQADPGNASKWRRPRRENNLPSSPPRSANGIECQLCGNSCRLDTDEKGFCGLRQNLDGRVVSPDDGTATGYLDWYRDPHPTNCVAGWVCPGGSDAGCPEYSESLGPEMGCHNLAVVYRACTFDCLGCQNWTIRDGLGGEVGEVELANAVNDETTCVCFFGGDPASQMQHALVTSELAIQRGRSKGRIPRICFETNGSANPSYMREAARFALETGGCIKMDLKAWDDHLHRALTGASNRATLQNFEMLAALSRERPDPPFLVASTLLIPGYVDLWEIAAISQFLSELDPDIPYSLLGFQPHYVMSDLPRTDRTFAEECLKVTQEAGLNRVQLGNQAVLV